MSRVCFITPRLGNNATGRTYSLWLLARACELQTTIISPGPAQAVWAPLAGTDFAADCASIDVHDPGGRARLTAELEAADAIVVVKAIPDSFGAVRALLRGRGNVVVDIDDPDLEAQSTWLPWRDQLNAARSKYYWALRRSRLAVRRYPHMLSNPVLQAMYGGTLIPHVRVDPGPPLPTGDAPPSVAFIGTPKKHKGIDVLRAAVAHLSERGYTLDVTAPAPPDAKPWERWHGFTSLARGMELTAHAGIVAIPSLAGGYARAQFPVKIVDALLAARPIVASDLGPMRWAVGAGGLLVPPGDVSALAGALGDLHERGVRDRLGATGRQHALANFTVESVKAQFEATIRSVIAR